MQPPVCYTLHAFRLHGWSSAGCANKVCEGPRHVSYETLSCDHWAFFISHRLLLPHPSITPARLSSCHPKCQQITSPSLAYTLPFGFHPMRCKYGNSRVKGHDSITRLAFTAVAAADHATLDLARHLQSSSTDGKQIDALLTAAHRTRPMCFDTTLACSLLPSYLPAAVRSADAIFAARAAAKIAKHAAGCAALNRDFLPFVASSFGGVGHTPFRDFLRSVYTSRAAVLIASGASAAAAAREFADLQCLIQAAITRALAHTLDAHTRA